MGAVKNAIQRDDLDPCVMDLNPEKSVASQLKKEAKDTGPPLKDDPTYTKYFKMLKMVSSQFAPCSNLNPRMNCFLLGACTKRLILFRIISRGCLLVQ